MQLGIIGLPQSGKTTIFNALTRGNQPTVLGGGKLAIHTAVVDVPDERIDRLSEMFKPQKTIYAKTTYVDFGGIEGSSSKDAAKGLSGPLLNRLSQMDGFLHVIRCFEHAQIPHPLGTVDPQRDAEIMDTEFVLNDLIMVERKLEKTREEFHKQGGKEKERLAHDLALFERLYTTLSEGIPLRTLEFTAEEYKNISSFGFLSLKPVLKIYNLGEGQSPPSISSKYPQATAEVALQGLLEMEIAQLPPQDAQVFMQEYGIEELSLSKVIRLSYQLLKLQSFFTVGEDEVRAWTIPIGATALEAAGEIHSDLAKGFIRAEVISYKELIALGGLAEARSQGKLRMEGKQYLVQDGDIVHIRFNI